ncbi:cytochrome C oxidase subunit III [Candidatus Marinamargulisbacteria bacterium SCGC AG-439-L15]|nr:cytochrome C oxidase subunit III [Candidatus Marinamargulisbacteria bacterium SCGC AG-439-L15]
MSEIPIKAHEVAHHFDTAEQEFDAAKIGMWAFIGQEILFFSALFVAYAVFRFYNPEMFADASAHLSWKMGFFNTLVLIFSSFTMVMAVRSAQLSKIKHAINYLITTLTCGGLFLVVKYFEYMEKIHHGYLPAKFFSATSQYDTLHIFYGIYFVATGLHAIHILIGLGLLIWLIIRAKKGHFHADYFTPVEMVGLYWHLVDIIWIFLFPLLYLI